MPHIRSDSTTAANAASSLNYHRADRMGSEYRCLSSGTTVRAQYPVIAEEIRENACAHGLIDSIMPWFDSHSTGYLGWTWSTYNCSSTPALISNYDGTPTNFGIGLKNHLLSLSGYHSYLPLHIPFANSIKK